MIKETYAVKTNYGTELYPDMDSVLYYLYKNKIESFEILRNNEDITSITRNILERMKERNGK